MTRRLTPAERLAAMERDVTLKQILDNTRVWDRFLVEQAVFCYGLTHGTFTANDLRDLLPEMGRGFIGVAINAMRSAGLIAKIPGEVPSTLKSTHGHGLKVWMLTAHGHRTAAQRFHHTDKAA